MRPPCEIVTQYFLPLLRGLVAKELIQHMTQQEVAEKMGVSQPTVSSYIKSLSKIQEEGIEEYLENTTIQQLAHSITKSLIQSHSHEEIIREICTVCVSLRIGGVTCRKHLSSYSDLQPGCQGCLPLINERVVEERKQVLVELLQAVDLLEREEEIIKLIPQVLMNICQSISSPKNIDDIAAIPGRITKLKGKAKAIMPPEFGVSEHLATVLLKGNAINDSWKSVLCILYNPAIIDALNQNKVPQFEITNCVFEDFFGLLHKDKTQSDQIHQFLSSKTSNIVAIINRGGIGIEPITYLFGSNSIVLAQLALRISKMI